MKEIQESFLNILGSILSDNYTKEEQQEYFEKVFVNHEAGPVCPVTKRIALAMMRIKFGSHLVKRNVFHARARQFFPPPRSGQPQLFLIKNSNAEKAS